jgi:hypothetical protein
LADTFPGVHGVEAEARLVEVGVAVAAVGDFGARRVGLIV